MNIPFIGPLTLSGFSSAWFFLYLIAVVGAVAIYLLLRKARRKRVLRFANTELLEQVVAELFRGAGGRCWRRNTSPDSRSAEAANSSQWTIDNGE